MNKYIITAVPLISMPITSDASSEEQDCLDPLEQRHSALSVRILVYQIILGGILIQ